eukprot:CAMPEP_0184650208 /NCGR_PEP_ID=MMETSP0308-20130426/7735_1 /TAXON_ID=38269 /ORGANISM="Gloeochaete witrockiana, Strain SAG 46.84" /LENGTH=332 /DNA_ID=CAMNT_0027083581 /DNA_START=93 /DNA_END=1088 /DNA_ORIENTATION=-
MGALRGGPLQAATAGVCLVFFVVIISRWTPFAGTASSDTQENIATGDAPRHASQSWPTPDARKFPANATVLQMQTEPPFLMVVPPEGFDMSVSRWLYGQRYFAPKETTIFRLLLERECGEARRTGKRPPLVVDIGANMGYFTFYALALGCRVVSFEPQAVCHMFMQATAAINSIALTNQNDRFKLYKAVASNVTGFFTLTVRGNSFGNTMVDQNFDEEVEDSVPALRLDDVIQLEGDDEIFLIKIDTEGHECAVFPSMMKLFRSGKIRVIVAEIKRTCVEFKKKFFEEAREMYDTYAYQEDYSIKPVRGGWPYDKWQSVGNQTFSDWMPPRW